MCAHLRASACIRGGEVPVLVRPCAGGNQKVTFFWAPALALRCALPVRRHRHLHLHPFDTARAAAPAPRNQNGRGALERPNQTRAPLTRNYFQRALFHSFPVFGVKTKSGPFCRPLQCPIPVALIGQVPTPRALEFSTEVSP